MPGNLFWEHYLAISLVMVMVMAMVMVMVMVMVNVSRRPDPDNQKHLAAGIEMSTGKFPTRLVEVGFA